MINICLFFGDIKRKLDCARPDLGNPGIGGTQWCILTLAYYLSQNTQKYKVAIISGSSLNTADTIDVIVSKESPVVLAQKYQADLLILKAPTSLSLQNDIAHSSIKVVLWAHNYLLSDFTRWASKTEQVKGVIFVGKEQYERYIDDDISTKSTYIYNIVNDNIHTSQRPNYSHNVVYMGAIVPSKGFHIVAKMWKGILKEVPNAKLLVIGSGRLYNDEAETGRFGIAADSYERSFAKYITDNNGELLPSVTFLGMLGKEKYDVFLNGCVGIINPSAKTECLPCSVIEMNSAFLPVVTKYGTGFPDVIKNGETGSLMRTYRGIQNEVIRYLKDKEMRKERGEKSKRFVNNFSAEELIPKWELVLGQILNDRFLPLYERPKQNYTNMAKWLRIINRYLRFSLRLKFIPSIISIETTLYKIIKSYRTKLGLKD